MNKTLYIPLLFGDVLTVKSLFVDELTAGIIERGSNYDYFDSVLRRINPRAYEYPSVRELIEDPSLYTRGYNQMLGWVSMDDESELIFQLSGSLLKPKVLEYLAVPENVDRAIQEFQSGTKISHVSVDPPWVELDKIIKGEPLRVGSPNHIPRIALAGIHIQLSIDREIGDQI